MKFSAYTFIGFLAFSLLSCDKVEQPYEANFEFDLSLFPGAEHEYPYPNLGNFPHSSKRVLLEEYTGHTCGNCPGAAVVAHDLKEQHGEDLVIVSLHASNSGDAKGTFQWPRESGEKYLTDFRTEDGNAYGSYFDIFTNPLGVIDRKQDDLEVYGQPKGTWETKIAEQLTQPLRANIQLEINYFEATRGLFCHVYSEALDNEEPDLAVIVMLLEDSIVDWQTNYEGTGDPSYPTGDVPNYLHEHVYFGNVNGTWGQDLGADLAPGAGVVLDYSAVIGDRHHGKMEVVAFVYDKTTKEVLQIDNKKFNVD